ncbi:cation efflux family-domain-containing protein [Russula brevipes]|nr:cation efflux family-domain-containing protein [Russula brevipes]
MDLTDSRTRKKVTLSPRTVLSKSWVFRQPVSGRVATDILFSNALLVASLWTVKEWLLSQNVGAFWVLIRVLACGAVGLLSRLVASGDAPKALAAVSSAKWTVLAMGSVAYFLQQGSLLVALSQLSATRVALFSHFSATWAKTLSSATLTVRFAPIALGLIISFASDTLHVLSTGASEHFKSTLVHSVGAKYVSVCCTVGAAAFGLGVYVARGIFVSTSVIIVIIYSNAPQVPAVSVVSLLAIPLAACSAQYGRNSFDTPVMITSQYYLLSSASTLLATIAFGFMWFSRLPTTTEILVGLFLSYDGPFPFENHNVEPGIAANFLFPCTNLSYMMVQMLYGVWTNSLGLISDAIHMGFDCMAIGVGLFASIMATWPPNERFTYGYGRIETLSGFANGIFLLLISIFIIFEATQRLLDPPEMNTNQLLLVSSLGLVINLFGMLAMGGHAHHGHSHGHGHGHGHAHHHGHSHHDHDHGHAHDHNHAHDSDSEHEHSHAAPTIVEYPAGLDHEDGCEGHGHEYGDTETPPHVHSERCHRPDSLPHSAKTSHTDAPSFGHLHPQSLSNVRVSSTISHSHTTPNLAPRANGHRRHSRRAPSLQLHGAVRQGIEGDDSSPMTPNYRFGVDEHFASHQHSHLHGHTPNLHDHSHVHGSGHSREGHSHNMRGLFLHVMADTLGSVGVIVSTLLIQFYGWTGFDPIASIFIALLIAASVVPLVIDTGKVLALDVAQRADSITQALDELASVEGLASYTEPQFWPKDAGSLIGSLHVQLAPPTPQKDCDLNSVVERVDTLLRARIPGLEELTIQVEETVLGAGRGSFRR